MEQADLVDHVCSRVSDHTAAIFALCTSREDRSDLAGAAIAEAPFLVAAIVELAGFGDHATEVTPELLLSAVDDVGYDACLTIAIGKTVETRFGGPDVPSAVM